MTAYAREPANPRATTFVGGRTGTMLVVSHTTLTGQPIARVDAIDMIAGVAATPAATPIQSTRCRNQRSVHDTLGKDRSEQQAGSDRTFRGHPFRRCSCCESGPNGGRSPRTSVTRSLKRSPPYHNWHAVPSGRREATASLQGP